MHVNVPVTKVITLNIHTIPRQLIPIKYTDKDTINTTLLPMENPHMFPTFTYVDRQTVAKFPVIVGAYEQEKDINCYSKALMMNQSSPNAIQNQKKGYQRSRLVY